MSNQIATSPYPPAAASAVVLIVIVILMVGAILRVVDVRKELAREERRAAAPAPPSFYLLAAFFTLFVLFLYGPMTAIYILSFQGPSGGLTFPMNGVSLTLVRRPVRPAADRRLRRLVPALDRAGAARDRR